MEFEAWPKIARLNRDIVITEKIDGTNAAVLIEDGISLGIEDQQQMDYEVKQNAGTVVTSVGQYLVGAQSRTRLITPEQDNFGFARWVRDNAEELVTLLGPGRHFGEWWGSGIQRGYGLTKGEKRFSLFNTERYAGLDSDLMSVVPELYRGPWVSDDYGDAVEYQVQLLREFGSQAAPGFTRPEGVVVFHTAARVAFKVTLENDEKPKGGN